MTDRGATLSPAEAAALREGVSARVGGRAIEVAEGRVVLADGLGSVEVRIGASEETGIAPGNLVELGVEQVGGALALRELVSVTRPRRFGEGDGDVAELLFRGKARRLAARARALSAIRAYFAGEGFVEVETPLLVPSPGLDLHLSAVAADGGYLITSPEYQMKRLLAGGVPRCFQLARCFRSGERGALHNPEFTMLEWYRSFAGYEDVMRDTEALVRVVARALRGSEELVVGGRRIPVDAPFERVTVCDAFAEHAQITPDEALRLSSEDEDAFFRALVDEVEPRLARAERPVFLCDYPVSQASLARRKPSDPRVAERFELYAGGVELCNGFGELTDPDEQRARLAADQGARRARGLPVYPIDERFLRALEEGLPRCAGNALGVDRLVSLALGASAIGDVQAFPADRL